MPHPDNKPIILPFLKVLPTLGNSPAAEYLFKNYLPNLKATTVIIEPSYIDKDFLIDYSHFYSRSYQDIKKYTKRVHFFSCEISPERFESTIKNGVKKQIKLLQDSYLGYVIVKPIQDRYGHKVIGKTAILPYPNIDNRNNGNRHYIGSIQKVSLYGIPFQLKALPFQAQDMVVGACATIACWTSLQQLRDIFGVQEMSPYEVTLAASKYSSLTYSRIFPSESLTISQLKDFFHSINLETEFIQTETEKEIRLLFSSDIDLIADVVKAYTLSLELPVIAALTMIKKEGRKVIKTVKHAVIISGFRTDNNKISKLYVHDDRIGPYNRIIKTNKGTFLKWKNEWV